MQVSSVGSVQINNSVKFISSKQIKFSYKQLQRQQWKAVSVSSVLIQLSFDTSLGVVNAIQL